MFSVVGIVVFAVFYCKVGSRFGKGSVIGGILLSIVSIIFWIAGEYALVKLTSMPLSFTGGVLAQVSLFIVITIYRMIRNKPLYHEEV